LFSAIIERPVAVIEFSVALAPLAEHRPFAHDRALPAR
jgi:hypothetical protein